MEALLGSFMPMRHEDAENHYQSIYHTHEIHPHHKASFTHEAIAGAAGFAAMRAYESHLRATGAQPSHSLMKEMLAGIAAAEVDKLVETKGMDWIDRRRAKKLAENQAHELAQRQYLGGTGWDQAQAKGGYAAEYNYGAGVPWGAHGHEGYAHYGPPASYGRTGYAQPGYLQQGYYQPEYGGYQAGFDEPREPHEHHGHREHHEHHGHREHHEHPEHPEHPEHHEHHERHHHHLG